MLTEAEVYKNESKSYPKDLAREEELKGFYSGKAKACTKISRRLGHILQSAKKETNE